MSKNGMPLLPCDKHDTETAAALGGLGWAQVEPIKPKILEWIQDGNWPVAAVLNPILASWGARLAPFLKPIFEPDDDIWKYFILLNIVRSSPELATAMHFELERIARYPTDNEQLEGVTEQAQKILIT